ncbi:hypothetical protein FOQG_15364 [Fusarium oxysporum f. sp. raphani 54005]|uniref:N-acetyltransferase domain-containing protein n=2 Tax=Fusarium oxysporum f. sp. raphani TaxID=96318 RepID=X0BNP0_FUSOX|nr:hypothetical protein FOQG_15364 [Fusarium oxysporum f. sp. raphani 54005]KAG7425818.1 Histone acetyltransferase GCN5 [Fusarium oxysporum f. sp. raphani]
MSSEEHPSPRRSIVPVGSASKEEDMAADAQGSEACQNQTEELDARYHDAVRGSPLPNKPAVIAMRNSEIDFRVTHNDGATDSMVALDYLKRLFQFQLPEMPKDYISRLVYDPSCLSITIVKKTGGFIGGITIRQLQARHVAQIIFCAVSSAEQVKGYGAALMDHHKHHIKATSSVTHLLVYADNYYVGFFQKQGFTKSVSLDQSVRMECVKGYEEVTLMQYAIGKGLEGRQYEL